MKNIYKFILIFFSTLLTSQSINPQKLLNKDWRLQKIQINGVELLPPPPVQILNSNFSYISSMDKYNFNPRYYNSGNCLVTFTAGENSFTYAYSQIPFIYSGENVDAVNNYDEMVLDFYLDYRSEKYLYDYIEDSNVYYMTITNPVGDKMYFKSTVSLSTNENKIPSIYLYPNPAKEFFTISAQKKIQSIIIIDSSGKIVLRNKPNSLNAVVDIKQLAAGTYYVSVDNMKSQKFIKN